MARFGSLDAQYFDDSGDPLVSGKVYFYESGTSTLKTTYSDVNLTIANTNPVILTAAGRQPNVFFDGVAKAILATGANVQILVRDPVGETTSAFGDAWISSKIYAANDVVQGTDGEFYVSLVGSNVNQNPVSTSGYWVLLYSVEWNAGITYTEGAVVTVSNILYQSLQNTNLNHNPTSSATYWVVISLAYVSTITYTVGQNVVGSNGIFYTALRTTVGDEPSISTSDWVGTSAAAAASATAAAASATAAAASASAASTSATAAAASASTATTQASNASTSASAASTSASNASTSATNAATSASSASTSATTATTQASNASTSATNASTSETNASTSATTAANYLTVGTSTTSVLIGTGAKSFTATVGKPWGAGQLLSLSSAANTANYMHGTVTSYNSGTGALVMNILDVGGSGTFADWGIAISGTQGPIGATGPTGPTGTFGGTAASTADFLTGTTIASASTINLDAATGNRVHISGTTAVTAVTLTRGPRTVVFDGILTLTHHTTTNNLPGAANITTAAGDRAIYESDGTTVYCVSYIKASGAAVVAGGSSSAEVSSAVDITLTAASDDIQAVAMTVADKKVTLPSATTLTAGTSYIIKNTGSLDFAVRKNGGLFLATLRPNQIAIFYCTNIGTAAGTWAVGDETVGDILNAIYAQTVATIASVTGDAQTGVCALSATQAVAVFRGTSNYLNACTLNLDSSNVLTAGAILVVNAVASSSMAITAMSSTQAIVVYAGTSTYLEARTLNVSGTTVTSGALLVVNATGTTQQSITTMSSTQAIVVFAGVSNYPEACTLNVSGTTLTNGTVVQINSNSSNTMDVAMASSTVAFCAYRNSSTFPAYARLTVSGTSITVDDIGAVGDSGCSLVRIANINSTTSAVFWKSALTGDNGSLMARVVNNPSGNNYLLGAAIMLPFVPTAQMYATKIRDNKIMIFTNANNAQYGVSIFLTVKDGLIMAADTAIVVTSMSTARNSIARFSDTLAVAVYLGTSDYKYANVIEITP